MYNIRILLIAFSVCGIGFTAVSRAPEKEEGTLIEQIKMYADSLQDALDVRNYKAAKEAMEVLFPLLERDLKASKKQVKDLKKAGQAAMAGNIANTLKMKQEVHDSLHAYLDASSAALRVKTEDVKTLVGRYVELLEEKEQLASSN